jgi:hypothetical protein
MDPPVPDSVDLVSLRTELCQFDIERKSQAQRQFTWFNSLNQQTQLLVIPSHILLENLQKRLYTWI